MVDVIVRRPTSSPTLTAVNDLGKRVSLIRTPNAFEYERNWEFETVDRQGLTPVVVPDHMGLARLSFKHTLASTHPGGSIEWYIGAIQALAEAPRKVRFVGGSPRFQQRHWWWASIKVDVQQLGKNNYPSLAVLTWDLVEASPYTAALVKPKPAPAKPVKKAPAVRKAPVSRPAVRSHKVVRGDTLWGLAQRYLGAGVRWPEIWALNKALIRNPHWIYPGQVFRIPAR